MTETIIGYLNDSDAPVLKNAAEEMYDHKLSEILDATSQKFYSEFIQTQPLPLDTSILFSSFSLAQNEYLKHYYKTAKPYLTLNSLATNSQRLMELMHSRIIDLSKKIF